LSIGLVADERLDRVTGYPETGSSSLSRSSAARGVLTVGKPEGARPRPEIHHKRCIDPDAFVAGYCTLERVPLTFGRRYCRA